MADQKVADFTAVGTINGNELIYTVDDPSGTPADKYITPSQLRTGYLDSFYQSSSSALTIGKVLALPTALP